MVSPLGSRYIRWLLALLLLTAVGLVCCFRTEETELGQRTGFYLSLVNKGDLNIIDQAPPPDRWLVTKNHNHPTHLGNGIVTVWYPFYEYARLISSKAITERGFVFELSRLQTAAVVRNAFFLLLSLIVMGRSFGRASRVLLPPLVLATPILWFAFFEPFSIETTSLAIAALLSLGLLECLDRPPTPRRLLVLGLGIGVAYTVVIAFAVFALPVLAMLAIRRTRLLRNTASLGLGLAIPTGLNSINAFFQNGSAWPTSYFKVAGLASGTKSHALELLLSRPNALLLSSPINLVLYLGLAVWFARRFNPRLRSVPVKNEAWLTGLVPLAFLVTFFLAMHRIPLQFDEISSRLLVYVFPVLAYGFVQLAGPASMHGRYRIPLATLLLACIAVNWGSVAQFAVHGIVLNYLPSLPELGRFSGQIAGSILRHASRPAGLACLGGFVPLIALLSWGLCYLDRILLERNRAAIDRLGAGLAILLTLGYAAVTSSNAVHNRGNVETLISEGFFENTVVSQGPELDVYDEVVSILENGIDFLPPDEAREAIDARASYLARAMPEVGLDPIGFRDAWQKGCIRPSAWSAVSARCASTSPPVRPEWLR